MLDLLIRDGLIIDGTGNPGFYSAVGVEGERIRILRGDLSGVQAGRVIDAKGLIVCPGFIDMHAHSGLVMLAEPHHEPKVRQGVTTELIGIDGCSYAPSGRTRTSTALSRSTPVWTATHRCLASGPLLISTSICSTTVWQSTSPISWAIPRYASVPWAGRTGVRQAQNWPI